MTNSNDDLVDSYNSRLQTLNIEQIIDDAHNKLTLWCNDCHKVINELYQQKLDELDSYINEQKIQYEDKKSEVQSYLNKLQNREQINDKDPVQIQSLNNSIEQDLHDIEQICLQINYRLLTMDDSYVRIERKFRLPNLSLNCPKFIYSDASSSAIASNDRFLLMHKDPYLCLINRDSQIVKQNSWTYGWIRDMCWSSTLNCFIILTANNLYCTDGITPSVTPFQVQASQVWFSCTCSETSLYLSTCEWGSAIFELSLSSPFNLINQYRSPLICGNDEGINDMKYNNETLALMIKDSTGYKRRIDLKSSKTFNTIWTYPLDVNLTLDSRLFTCCSLKNNEWLIIDGTNSTLYHITKDGKCKNNIHYRSVPYRANLFGSNLLAISAEFDLSLHSMAS